MILCCGEALIDMIPVEMPGGKRAFVPHTGGAIFNTAIALGRLGADAGLLSGVSTDAFGQMLAEALTSNGVATGHLIRSDRLTTLAMVHLDDGSATYSFYDENSAGSGVTASDLPPLGAQISALYFGGISLVAEPAAEAYAALLAREHSTRVVMLDPNIRPGFIMDEPRYRARLGRMIGQCDILKVSDEDLDWLCPDPQSMADKVRSLRDQGPAIVIVTLGAKGAQAFFGGQVLSVPAPAPEVVDTVGAGDTFNAGVLAGLMRAGWLAKDKVADIPATAVQEALEWGTRVAAVTVSRAGANPPFASEVGL